ncbi:unnamed protein product [Closterium sp. Naga37s-1]|nr:unnamed protein product [Closterium sp. Naga37s-1]
MVRFADVGCGFGGLLGALVTAAVGRACWSHHCMHLRPLLLCSSLLPLSATWQLGKCSSPLLRRRLIIHLTATSVKLSPMFPDTLMVGFELRDKVSEYVKDRILALRQQHPSQYTNISLIRTNAMKYLPNYFNKAQAADKDIVSHLVVLTCFAVPSLSSSPVSFATPPPSSRPFIPHPLPCFSPAADQDLTKMFFLFPDPHFKEKNHRRRIITMALLAEYAYVLAPGGIRYSIMDVEELGMWMAVRVDSEVTSVPLPTSPLLPLPPVMRAGILYSITDVEELGTWMDDHLAAHPLFHKLTAAQMVSSLPPRW